jgi:hypothetical protein
MDRELGASYTGGARIGLGWNGGGDFDIVRDLQDQLSAIYCLKAARLITE